MTRMLSVLTAVSPLKVSMLEAHSLSQQWCRTCLRWLQQLWWRYQKAPAPRELSSIDQKDPAETQKQVHRAGAVFEHTSLLPQSSGHIGTFTCWRFLERLTQNQLTQKCQLEGGGLLTMSHIAAEAVEEAQMCSQNKARPQAEDQLCLEQH